MFYSGLSNRSQAGNATGVAVISLVVAVAALGVACFSAYQTHLSAASAIANARPLLKLVVPEPIRVDDSLKIPLRLTNYGRSRASIKYVRVVYYSTDAEYKYYEPTSVLGDLIDCGSFREYSVTLPRVIQVGGGAIDVSRGCDAFRRLRLYVAYTAPELADREFEQRELIPAAWRE